MSYNTMRKVRASIQALKDKNLLPKHMLYKYEESQIKNHAMITDLQTFKEWSCPFCHITVFGSKEMLIDHHKTHSLKRDLKENEYFSQDYKLY